MKQLIRATMAKPPTLSLILCTGLLVVLGRLQNDHCQHPSLGMMNKDGIWLHPRIFLWGKRMANHVWNLKRALTLVSGILITACSSLPNKQSIVVDEYKMVYAVQGEDAPVVVLESGFGAPMENWSKVFSEIGAFSTVFAYNRRGYEGSVHQDDAKEDSITKDIAKTVGEVALDVVAPAASTAVGVVTTANSIAKKAGDDEKLELRAAIQVIEELRALLAKTSMKPPYVLVGHSSGGLYSLYYAKTYPQEVAGLVLVDSSHPEQLLRCRERYGEDKCDVPWLMKSVMKILPEEMLAEFYGLEETGRQVIAAGPLPPIPLIVISHGKKGIGSAPIAEMWPEFQRELAAQSPTSVQILAENSGHFIQKDQPVLVVEAIKRMVNGIRKNSVQ